jgi:hypothetical protein
MRMRTPFLAGALSLAFAVPAQACTFWFNSSYMSIPARPSFGVGMVADFDPTVLGISGDVAMRLGDKAIVRPAIGLCTYEILDERQNDPYFGAGVAFNLTQTPAMSLNLQSGISYWSLDGGSVTTVPIGAAARFGSTGPMAFYAGASLLWQNFESDAGGSVSETDPLLFGGLQAGSGAMAWTLGAQILLADDTEFGIVAGLSLNQGMSAIRRIGSVFNK